VAHRPMNDLYTITPSQIVMYATEYCSDCLRAKKFFEANHIPHLQVGLEGNAEATQFVIKVNNGYRSVPTIVFPDGSILVERDSRRCHMRGRDCWGGCRAFPQQSRCQKRSPS
jgi:mycoredoxin